MEYVKQLNVAMGKISSSSEEISKIIATIENIAFQTNDVADGGGEFLYGTGLLRGALGQGLSAVGYLLGAVARAIWA